MQPLASLGRWIKGWWRDAADLMAADPVRPAHPAHAAGPAWLNDNPPNLPNPTNPRDRGPKVGPPISPYEPIRAAMERTLKRFADKVQDHLIDAPHERFSVRYLTLTGHDEPSRLLIARYFDEFRDAKTRTSIALKAIERNFTTGVLTDQLMAFKAELSADELAPFDQWNAQLASDADLPDMIELGIVGEWTNPAPTRPQPHWAGSASPTGPSIPSSPSSPSSQESTDVSQRQMVLEIHDADGSRSVALLDLPITLGRDSEGLPHAMQGKFLSRIHARLLLEAHNSVVLLNLSGNGSLVDGQQVLKAGERTPLRNGARVALGRTQDRFATGTAECPQIVLRWASTGNADGPTPVTAEFQAEQATPINLGAGPLCSLAVQDAESTRTCTVLSLPYTVGRDPASNCRLPEANSHVSRTHLELLALDADGARVRNHAVGKPWGTTIDGIEQAAEFSLPWGATVVLAGRSPTGKPAQLQLQPPGH